MGRLAGYVAMVSRSRLLAPNLRRLKLTVYAGNAHRGNAVARALVARHLLALRWMNPNAQVALKEIIGVALELSKLQEITGRDKPTVIT